MLLRLLKVASAEQKASVLAVMNKTREQKTDQDVQYVLSLMKSHGAIEYAERKARALVDEALAAMKTVHWRGEPASLELLESAARFAVERKW